MTEDRRGAKRSQAGAATPAPTAAQRGPVSHAVFQVARLSRMAAGNLLLPIGLYPGREIVMMNLWDLGPQRQADLVRLGFADAATMTRMIRRMEHAGFVRRTPSIEDKCAFLIEATPAGGETSR